MPDVAQHNVIIYEPEDLLHTDAVARYSVVLPRIARV